ncbi:QRFP-like peptide receptor [Littorina saxatilis]|uniref:QRFP-like peptide receptor n=1 Tax=Littorina saxatilis TaxID=31220 RepID=UPI0038B5B53A
MFQRERRHALPNQPPAMDQILEFSSLKIRLEEHNLTVYPDFNFTGADEVLTEFQHVIFGDFTFSDVILLSLYAPVFLVALFGNLLVLVTLVRQRKTLCKPKNLYMLNLALADLLVTLLCMPATVGMLINRLWLYGEFLCKFMPFLQGVAVTSSIFTLTAMSIDRYISIQHPMTSLTGMTSRQALAIVFMTWIVSAVFISPLLYVRQVDTPSLPDLSYMTFCIEDWPQDYDRHIFGLVLLVVIFILPSLTLAICYVHIGRTLCSSQHYRQSSDSSAQRIGSRKRAARMLLILVLVFIVCWLPNNITSLCIDLLESYQPVDVLPFTLCLGHAHSAINPVMYWVMNRRFRHNVTSLLRSIKQSNHVFCTTATHASPRYV